MELPLLTPRLVLRAWTDHDVDAAYRLLGNAETMGRMRAGRAGSREDAEEWICHRVEQQATHGVTMWAIERRNHAGLIGACGVFPKTDGLELGYIVDHRHVGKGFATEAATGVCAAIREERPDARVYATIRPHNVASICVAERVGLRLVTEVVDNAGVLLVYEL